jgi:hypothetical protein
MIRVTESKTNNILSIRPFAQADDRNRLSRHHRWSRPGVPVFGLDGRLAPVPPLLHVVLRQGCYWLSDPVIK